MLLLSLFCILICKYVESGHFTSPLPVPTTYGFTETLFHPTTFQFFGPPLTHSFVPPPVLFQSDILIHQPPSDSPKKEEKLPTEEKNKETSSKKETKTLMVDPMYQPIHEIKKSTPKEQPVAMESFPPLFNTQRKEEQLPSKKIRITSYGHPYKESGKQDEYLKKDKSSEEEKESSQKEKDKKVVIEIPKDFFYSHKLHFSKLPSFPTSFQGSVVSSPFFDSFEFPWSDFQKEFHSKKNSPWAFEFSDDESVSQETIPIPKEVPTSTSPPPLIKKRTETISKSPKQTDTKIKSLYCKELGCKMNFAIYLPSDAEDRKLPVIYWLSGLTCTEQNFIQKSGAQKYATSNGVILVAPDTSPRGCNIAGEDISYDFGTGAGFYVNATEEPWKKNYRMYSYVTSELPQIISDNFPVLADRQSIMGHSMGGHGALISALKNPSKYRSVSAFAPICNPSNCDWGRKALAGYLGKDKSAWANYDSTELVKTYEGPLLEILIDQGKSDEFYEDKKQLLPENLVEACKEKGDGVRVVFNIRDNYDHSYYFIASFIEEHIAYHARHLKSDS